MRAATTGILCLAAGLAVGGTGADLADDAAAEDSEAAYRHVVSTLGYAAPDASDGNDECGLALAAAHASSGGIAVLLRRPATFGAGAGAGTALQDDDPGGDDTTPDAFRFEDQTGVEPKSVITSDAITVSGLDAEARIEVSGGKYSVGCTTSFRSSSSTVGDGEAVCVRHTSAAGFDAATDTTLTIGGVADTFTSVTQGADTTPDPFAFTDVGNALLNSPQVSDSVTIRGIRSAAPVSVTGGAYSLGCTDAFTGAAGTIAPDATVCVRHTSSVSHGTATDTTLTVGGVSDTFTSTTPAPQDFSQTGAPAPLDLLLGLLALGIARRRRAKKSVRPVALANGSLETGPCLPSIGVVRERGLRIRGSCGHDAARAVHGRCGAARCSRGGADSRAATGGETSAATIAPPSCR